MSTWLDYSDQLFGQTLVQIFISHTRISETLPSTYRTKRRFILPGDQERTINNYKKTADGGGGIMKDSVYIQMIISQISRNLRSGKLKRQHFVSIRFIVRKSEKQRQLKEVPLGSRTRGRDQQGGKQLFMGSSSFPYFQSHVNVFLNGDRRERKFILMFPDPDLVLPAVVPTSLVNLDPHSPVLLEHQSSIIRPLTFYTSIQLPLL